MHNMPETLQEDVKMAECNDLMNNVPFLENIDREFLRCFSLKTSSYMFAPGDYVLYFGDMGREMYLIKKGHVEVSIRTYAYKCNKLKLKSMYVDVVEKEVI